MIWFALAAVVALVATGCSDDSEPETRTPPNRPSDDELKTPDGGAQQFDANGFKSAKAIDLVLQGRGSIPANDSIPAIGPIEGGSIMRLEKGLCFEDQPCNDGSLPHQDGAISFSGLFRYVGPREYYKNLETEDPEKMKLLALFDPREQGYSLAEVARPWLPGYDPNIGTWVRAWGPETAELGMALALTGQVELATGQLSMTICSAMNGIDGWSVSPDTTSVWLHTPRADGLPENQYLPEWDIFNPDIKMNEYFFPSSRDASCLSFVATDYQETPNGDRLYDAAPVCNTDKPCTNLESLTATITVKEPIPADPDEQE